MPCAPPGAFGRFPHCWARSLALLQLTAFVLQFGWVFLLAVFANGCVVEFLSLLLLLLFLFLICSLFSTCAFVIFE